MSKSKLRPEFKFLNRLRESGATNMFGATPYIEEAFDLDPWDAKKILIEWMEWVNQNPKNLKL